MRIGIRVSPSTSGGGKAYIESLRDSLHAHPSVSSVTIFMLGAPTAKSISPESVVVVDIPSGAVARRLRGPRALAAAIVDNPVDVLLCPGNEATRVPGLPVVLWPMTVAPFEPAALAQLGSTRRARLRWSLVRRSVTSSIQTADAVVFSSHYARALHVENVTGLRDKPTAVIAPAHTLPDERPSTSREIADPYLLFVSHLYPYKMVTEMITGYARAVRSGGIPHHLVIAGNPVDADYAARLRDVIRAEGVEGRVLLLGAVEQRRLPGLYQHADLFLFPSISENAGSFALIDAFTMGVPVLSSSTSSMPEACQDAVRYFDPRDPDQLASEIVYVLGDPAVHKDLARRSAARADAFPTWSDVGERLVEFLETLDGVGP